MGSETARSYLAMFCLLIVRIFISIKIYYASFSWLVRERQMASPNILKTYCSFLIYSHTLMCTYLHPLKISNGKTKYLKPFKMEKWKTKNQAKPPMLKYKKGKRCKKDSRNEYSAYPKEITLPWHSVYQNDPRHHTAMLQVTCYQSWR